MPPVQGVAFKPAVIVLLDDINNLILCEAQLIRHFTRVFVDGLDTSDNLHMITVAHSPPE